MSLGRLSPQVRRIHVSNIAPIAIQGKSEQKAQAKTEAKPKRIKTFSIYRWNPDNPNEKPKMQDYDVDLNRLVIYSNYDNFQRIVL